MTDFVHSGDSAGFHVPPAYARCFRNLSAPPKSRSLLQKTPQGSPADAEAFGSRALVALCLLQDGADNIAADLIERAVQTQQGPVGPGRGGGCSHALFIQKRPGGRLQYIRRCGNAGQFGQDPLKLRIVAGPFI